MAASESLFLWIGYRVRILVSELKMSAANYC